MQDSFSLTGQLVDLHQQRIYPATIQVERGIIKQIGELAALPEGIASGYILPGFVDAHVHIESSMLTPSQFARLAVVHGTVATVSDPHEIANVCGVEGVEFMITDGKKVPFKFNFGAPSCVPATSFETAGAELNSEAIDRLLQREEVRYLAEMMNFPGVLQGEEEVLKKIAAAKRRGKPVDGHAPGLRGEDARKYIEAGMSTDHECFTAEEALDKLACGMKILIREGSAAKNFEALIPLLAAHSDHMMFCSDDKHPDSLVEGHINQLCARAVAKGIGVFQVLRAACLNPVMHYRLPVGLLRQGDPADLIVVNDLEQFQVLRTYVDGILVAEGGDTRIETPEEHTPAVNQFNCNAITPADLAVPALAGNDTIAVIEALDGQLITNKRMMSPKVENGYVVSDPEQDVLKIVVVNRYRQAPPARAFIRNIGLKKGAIASSVAHDSHNIVAVGVDDDSLCRAVNLVIREQGGVSCVGDQDQVLPLPVAGLMSNDDGYRVSEAYASIDRAAKALGSSLSAPYMTLSFMALLVIPHLKLSDKGLFDGDRFGFLIAGRNADGARF